MRLLRPSSDSASRAAHVAGRPLTTGTALPATLTGIRIVLVEDHDDTRDMLEQVLRQLGATVSSATLAREALAMLAEADIVLTDFALRGEDGVWLLNQVHKGARSIPVIALSGFAESEEPRLSEAPFTRKLLKPVDPWALADMIREVVHARS
jgi:CheY-like chemotaxis protein